MNGCSGSPCFALRMNSRTERGGILGNGEGMPQCDSGRKQWILILSKYAVLRNVVDA